MAARWHRSFALLVLAAMLLAAPDPLAVALAIAPALLVIGLCTAGIRPGEALIERWHARRLPPRRARAASLARPRLAFVVCFTGRLLGAASAVRPPPSLARLIH